MLFEQDIQTGMMVFVLTVFIQEQVKRSAESWSYSLKDMISYSKHQGRNLKEQIKNSRPMQGDLEMDDQG